MIPIDHQYLYDKLHFFEDAEAIHNQMQEGKK